MYEPIRTKSVHSTMAGTPSDFPHRSREEELDIQLAGHLAALLAVTDELRTLAPAEDLDIAAERLAAQVARLRGGLTPARMSAAASDGDSMVLHQRAHALAGRALVVAASRADTAAAILAAEQMDVHAAALEPRELASH
ncbi:MULTISPECIES: SCO4983 family protein [unclassified Streptomyces]|uniref:SCO4983 family protein n=1 Tax=unclassified Streptomyces TaxID=2593676 RepID=UPI00224F1348|nr:MULTISPECIES: hypothetical protein [unclassified Streptomyces]MCX5050708.1 hypothetical protein [Streptomyces sp. NBC_00474]MCX5061084.1 hypothetical protein [Streptomyces sp. NBC_00452]MCX5248615.1 hypothetical protein [Streptomyces sp. NBC_00201]MCX5293291.1 hypothetical protein [Streptomyces sp. NBC_00183]